MEKIFNLHIFEAVIEIKVYLTGSDYRLQIFTNRDNYWGRKWRMVKMRERQNRLQIFYRLRHQQCVSQWTTFNAATRTHPMGFYPPYPR